MLAGRRDAEPPAESTGCGIHIRLTTLIHDCVGRLSAAEFKVAAYLYGRMDDEDGPVQASIAEMAEATRLAPRTVQACRKHLIECGVIQLISRGRQRSEYDVPASPAGTIDPEPPAVAATASKPAAPLASPGPTTTNEVDPEVRIASLAQALSGSRIPVTTLKEAAGTASHLLEALEALAKDGPQLHGAKPGVFLAALNHKAGLLRQKRRAGARKP